MTPRTEAGKRMLDDDYYRGSETAGYIAAIEAEVIAPLDAEIARLREIEAAARDVDNLAPAESQTRRGNWMEDGVQALAALRAALEGGET